MSRLAFASVLLALVAAPAAADAGPQPWYQRESCQDALAEVLTAEANRAEVALRPLERSRDADDVACAVYLRVVKADFDIAANGKTRELWSERDRRIKRMFAFAKAHAKYGPRFADLEMEARMRRVRVLFEADERAEAVGEARRTYKLLKQKHRRDRSPTVEFVRGALYGSLGQAGSLGRMLLGMAGIGGDPDEGYAALKRLRRGSSVYRPESMQLARQFAEKLGDDGPLGSPVDRGDELVRDYPQNPQYAYDHTFRLLRRKQSERGLQVLRPHLKRMQSDPDAWAPTMRAKLHYLATRCALGTGDVGVARRHHDAMAAQQKNDFSERLAGLTEAVQRAEGAAH